MRILLVDDEPVSLAKMDILFSEYGSCNICSNGKDAIDLFEKAVAENKPYRLIALDIELPDISGLELLQYFCVEETIRNVPVSKKIMITADNRPKTVTEAGKSRCDAYLVKPLRRDELSRKMQIMSIRRVQTNVE
jgi:DNA-binding response OmpR family regulator